MGYVRLLLIIACVTAVFNARRVDDFEKLMDELNVDMTLLNRINKDECLANRRACARWVREQHAKHLDTIGRVHEDEMGEPQVAVPKSLIYGEELLVPDGGDSP